MNHVIVVKVDPNRDISVMDLGLSPGKVLTKTWIAIRGELDHQYEFFPSGHFFGKYTVPKHLKEGDEVHVGSPRIKLVVFDLDDEYILFKPKTEDSYGHTTSTESARTNPAIGMGGREASGR